MRHKEVKTQDVVVMYTEKHLTHRQIGKIVGMSQTAVWKRLRSAGITAKQGTWVKTSCAFCGSGVDRTRQKVRDSAKQYCGKDCYFAGLENPSSVIWRQGSRLARVIVAHYFDLRPDHVVHHEDTNQRNNDRSNLIVFKDQGDHIKWHRLGGEQSGVKPLWTART
jgi:hypothetical protein